MIRNSPALGIANEAENSNPVDFNGRKMRATIFLRSIAEVLWNSLMIFLCARSLNTDSFKLHNIVPFKFHSDEIRIF